MGESVNAIEVRLDALAYDSQRCDSLSCRRKFRQAGNLAVNNHVCLDILHPNNQFLGKDKDVNFEACGTNTAWHFINPE